MRRLLLLSLILAGCQAGTPLPLSVMSGMLQGCLQVNTQSQCDCRLAEVQKRMSLEEYREFEASLRLGSQPDPKFAKIMAEATGACSGR